MSNETPGVRAWAVMSRRDVDPESVRIKRGDADYLSMLYGQHSKTVGVHILTDEQMAALLAERERVGRLKELLEDCLKFTCAYGGRGVNSLNERIHDKLED